MVGENAMSLATTPLAAVQNLVESLNTENVRTRSALERALGIVLKEDGGTSAFSAWNASNTVIGGLSMAEISYREPRPNSGATAGAILVVRLGEGACVDRTELLAGYPGMALDGPPAPDDPAPNQYYKQETAAASLSFGFPVNGADCLDEIVYSLKRP
jgi:hypothetical protein